MNQKALHNLAYGLYVLTAREGNKDNGCLVNSAFQAAAEPPQIGVSVLKPCCTHGMIYRTGIFNISVLGSRTPMGLINWFGSQTGLYVDKFENFAFRERAANGVYYIRDFSNAYISARVNRAIDLGTHTLFIGKVTDMVVLHDAPSAKFQFSEENGVHTRPYR